MDDRAPRIDPASPSWPEAHRRNLSRHRETEANMRVGNCAVRIGHLGAVSDRAPADQRTADGRRESTAPPARGALRADDAKD